ncbi:DUF4231 domain-containing protein [Cohnella soli]|uniref:DUF4231 domain-containing protein n=1 Tax=Cohnella soli TaxID=425005 RepID=A0ABW0HM44_9BACL
MNARVKFPTIQGLSDHSSEEGQRQYLLLNKLQLMLLLFSTVTTIFVSYNRQLLFLVLFFMIGSFVVTTAIKIRKPERFWYDGRAIAESIKTLTWRFIMKAEPFNQSDTKDKELFIRTIKKITDDRKYSQIKIVSIDSEIITDSMLNLRSLSFEERKEFYITERITDQKKWYSGKSDFNKMWESRLFYLSLITQFLAIAFLILMLTYSSIRLNLTSLFTSLVTISLTWMQLKQHHELAQAYAMAANELMVIESLGSEVFKENSLSEYVNESENAISREHTMWIARRGQ